MKALAFGLFIVSARVYGVGVAVGPTASPAASAKSASEGGYAIYRQMAARDSVCATNALYLLLRLEGWQGSYEAVQAAVGGDSRQGKSLLEVRKACERLGVPAVVLKSPIEELRRCRVPMVVYGMIGRPISGPLAAKGHFIILVNFAGDDVRFIDSTTAENLGVSIEWLLEQGGHFYYLQLEPNDNSRIDYFLSASAAGLLAACLLVIFRDAWKRRKSPRPAPLPIATFFLMASFLANGADGFDSVGPQHDRQQSVSVRTPGGIWRRPGCDGVNSLRLFLRVHDVAVNYEELSKRLGGHEEACSLRDLRDAARQFGLKAVVAKVDFRSLAHSPLPVVALLDSDRGKGSYFVLVCGVSPNEVEYIDGAYAIWQKDDVEVFLRKWSGFALMAPDDSGRGLSSYVLWLIAGIILSCYVFVRLRFHRGRVPRSTCQPVPNMSPTWTSEGSVPLSTERPVAPGENRDSPQ